MRFCARLAMVGISVGVWTTGAYAQQGAEDGQWRHYAGDRGSTKYSGLGQINRANVGTLTEAWRWASVETDTGQRGIGGFKATPLYVNGVLYTSTSVAQVAAIDPATGKTLWVYDPEAYKIGRPANSGFQHRGVDYWTDGTIERLLIATGGRQLISIDAKTGKPDPKFGTNGIVDLSQGLGKEFNARFLGYNAPPVVCRDMIVMGSIITDGGSTKSMPPGHIRGFDVRTGEQKWMFHTIPQAGEFGNDTWLNDSWTYSGNTNAWSMMSVDEDLGYVYAPIGTPTSDWYGALRPGANLFAESLVCLNAATGERVWHFQVVHHGMWDYDLPAAPILCDLNVGGRPIKAVAQVTKHGFTFVFNRETGEPVWPIEERPVPQNGAPGEWVSPTQPFPTKPPAFERQGVTEDDLIDFTPELRAEAINILKQYTAGPLFSPPSVITETNKGTATLPSPAGGANWGGACLDPETNWLYVPSMTWLVSIGLLKNDANRSEFEYGINAADFMILSPQGLPIVKPPYGRITAIDLNKGEIAWQVAHGDGPRDHPALQHLDLPPLGSATNGFLSNGGGVLTKELLFMIQPDPSPSSVMQTGTDGVIRAFDKTTGEELWEQKLGAVPHGTPMTYMHEGKQYLVLAVGGQTEPASLVAFRLP